MMFQSIYSMIDIAIPEEILPGVYYRAKLYRTLRKEFPYNCQWGKIKFGDITLQDSHDYIFREWLLVREHIICAGKCQDGTTILKCNINGAHILIPSKVLRPATNKEITKFLMTNF